MSTLVASDVLSCARGAAQLWAKRPLNERLICIRRLRAVIVERQQEIIDQLHRITGKPRAESLISELFPTLDLIRHYEKSAPRYLASIKSRDRLAFPGSVFENRYVPLGVVLILSPWNFPFQLSMIPAVTALIAGNAVVLKPSELVDESGALMQSLFMQAGFPPTVVQIVSGGADFGQALIKAHPDFIFLTGDSSTGKKVMSCASDQLIPVLLELGGKDPMIVFDDAPFERAVRAAVYGAFCNSGQVCVSVERLFVQEKLAERFEKAVAQAALALRVGNTDECELGPLISSERSQRIRDQIDDAIKLGACLLTPLKINGAFMWPVVISNVTPEMKIMRQETFGPVLPIMRFSTEEQAIQFANSSDFGLSASVWSKDLEKAHRVAEKLQAGSIGINDVIKNIGNPRLPFGGTKKSGFGRYRGAEGLRALSRQLTIMTNHGKRPREFNWFPYSASFVHHLLIFIRFVFGTRHQKPSWLITLSTFRYFRRRLKS